MLNNIKTLKLEYDGTDIYKMKVIDKSLYIYYDNNKTNQDELLKQFEKTKFKLIPREYLLHVSAKDENTFNESFSNYKDNIIIYSQQPKFIGRVKVDTEEEYYKYLNMSKDNIRIKPYLHRLQYKENKNYTHNYNTNLKYRVRKN